jgi:hypothetical protein
LWREKIFFEEKKNTSNLYLKQTGVIFLRSVGWPINGLEEDELV